MSKSIDYYNWKLNKLKMIIELCAPDDAGAHDEIHASGAIAAIAEMNKMQGHYMKSEADHQSEQELKSISTLLSDLKKKHECDY